MTLDIDQLIGYTQARIIPRAALDVMGRAKGWCSMVYLPDSREIAASPKVQGASEARAYSFDFGGAGVTTIAGTPTVTLYDCSTDPPLDVSGSKLSSQSAPASGLVATMSGVVQGLAADTEYRLVARVTHDGNQTSELFCRIFGRQ